ncbi:MAG: xanthine dehydrogenase small subunit, partial [Burkholderiales bacterium]|nr:xanthine dehydrogenase small subunit [Burkholderiales bacterium]
MSDPRAPRPVRFFHRGAVTEVAGAAPTRTVLEWLREDARCTGTKEGCAEGDCGACTVVLGELDAAGALTLRPVNACIQFLPTLDGKALFTVEDLASLASSVSPVSPAPPPQSAQASSSLHPVQQAMVACHGSQCGFCTPGFVMSLWACYEQHHAGGTRPTRQQLADDLSGNLCRCTGYRPILDAGERMFALPPAALAREPVAAALRALQAQAPLLEEGRFSAPRTVQAFAALRLARPQARLLAGSTDIGLWVTKQFRDPGELLYIGNVAELQRVEHGERLITIGAAASLQAAWQALVAEWPTLRDLWLRFASLPIRRAGTMGGNLANGSPIGDSAPVLMALGAQLVLRRGERVRRLALDDFYLDYMKNRLEPGEFVQAIEVPRAAAAAPAAPAQVRAYKISKRFDCDISALCAGLALRLDGARVAEVRLAYGGMAATVRRAAGA